MRKGIGIVLLCVLLCAGCASTAAPVHPKTQPYVLHLSPQGYVIFDSTYKGTLTEETGTKLTLSLTHLQEIPSKGEFQALLTIETQFTNLSVRGSIASYHNGHFPASYGDGPLLINVIYLGTLGLMSGTVDMRSGKLTGNAALDTVGTNNTWELSPL